MRIFNIVITPVPDSLQFNINWCVDVQAQCMVRYGLVSTGVLSQSTVVSTATTFGSWLSADSTLQAGMEYRVQVLAQATYGGTLISSDWLYFIPTIVAEVTPEPCKLDLRVYPRATLSGDRAAEQFAPWMAMSNIPGTIVTPATNMAYATFLSMAQPPNNISVGMIATCDDDLANHYHVTSCPALGSFTVTALAGTTFTLPASTTTTALLASIQPLAQCWALDTPSDVYYVAAINTATNTIQLDRIPATALTTVSWAVELCGITVDYPVNTVHSTPINWYFDTVARRLLEGTFRPMEEAMTMTSAAANMYTPRGLDPMTPWLGNMAYLPPTSTTTSTTVLPTTSPTALATTYTIERTSTMIPDVNSSNSTNTHWLPLLCVDNLYDLLNLPTPCYYLDTSNSNTPVALFHNLTLIEEEIVLTATTDSYGNLTTVGTLSYPLIIHPSQQTGTPTAELPIYTEDLVYGWTTLSNYTITPIYASNSTTGRQQTQLTFTGNVGTSVTVRYAAAPTWDAPYAPVVDIIVNGTPCPGITHTHMLWDQFDELGLFFDVRRFHYKPYITPLPAVWVAGTVYTAGTTVNWHGTLYQCTVNHTAAVWASTSSVGNQPGMRSPDGTTKPWAAVWTMLPWDYESNIRMQERLIAATCIDTDPTPVNALGWSAIRLGCLQYLNWDVTTNLTLPAGTVQVVIPDLPQLFGRENATMLHDPNDPTNTPGTPQYRYTFQEDPYDLAATVIYFNGIPVDRAIQTDPTNPGLGSFIVLTPAEWGSNITVTASYQVALYTPVIALDGTISQLTAGVSGVTGMVDVFAINALALTSFSDPTFRATLLDNYGLANQVYRNYAASLFATSPIITDCAVWGSTPWFSRDDVTQNPYLTRLPYGWS